MPIDKLNSGNNVLVAEFTDSGQAAVSGDFTATLNWGGASCPCTVVPVDGGGFDVYASAATPFAGASGSITVTVNDSDGASGTVTDSSLVFDSGLPVTIDNLPSDSNVSVTNGTQVSFGGNSVNVTSFTLVDGSVTDGTITAAQTYTVENGSISANLGGSVGLTMSGDGLVEVTGDNTYTGGTTIEATTEDTGTLAINSDQALGNPSGGVTFAGDGTLQALDDLNLSASRVITTPASASLYATIDTNGFDVAFPGTIAGTGGLVAADSSDGSGTLDPSGGTNNGFQGGITIPAGFVAASAASNLGGSGLALIFDGGGLRWTSGFTIPSGEVIDVQAGGATFDTNGFNAAIAATIGGDYGNAAGGITVMDSSANGTGVLTLTGDNLYEGGATIVSGTLAIGSDAALGDGGSLTFTGQGGLQATGNLTLGSSRQIVTPDDPTLSATIDSNGYHNKVGNKCKSEAQPKWGIRMNRERDKTERVAKTILAYCQAFAGLAA